MSVEDSNQKISLVGHGNVGSHLYQAFTDAGIAVSHILIRNGNTPSWLNNETEIVSQPQDLPHDQLVLICVPDSAIPSLIDSIPESCPIAYTSGSVDLNSLPKNRTIGVFYPLQTFTVGTKVNLFEVPIFIESNETNFSTRLFDLAWVISRKVSYANSTERLHLHIAAVFINNFTNHIAYISKKHLDEHGLNFDHLKPLLKETAQKLETSTPFDAQTGPARRNDQIVIQRHLENLDGTQRELYELLTKSIHKTYFND